MTTDAPLDSPLNGCCYKERCVENERRLSALQADAERYRWLRDKSPGQFEQPIVVTQARSGDHMKYVGPLAYADLDAAIDAARGMFDDNRADVSP